MENTSSCGRYSEYLTVPSLMTTGFTLSLVPNMSLINGNDADGLSAIDLYYINLHLEDISYLTGYPLIAADADGDKSLGEDDLGILNQLALGVTSTLPVNTWSYVHQASTQEVSLWPHDALAVSNLSFVGGVTRNALDANPSYYLDYRAIKVGDVNGDLELTYDDLCAGPGGVDMLKRKNNVGKESKTSHVSDVTSPRATYQSSTFQKGERFYMDVYFNGNSDVFLYQIPLYVDHTVFKVNDVYTKEYSSPQWHFNPENDRLMMLDYKLREGEFVIPGGGQGKITIELEAISDVNSEKLASLKIDERKETELMNDKLEDLPWDLSFNLRRMEEVNSNSLRYYRGMKDVFEWDATSSGSGVLTIFNALGQVVANEKIYSAVGENTYATNLPNQSGVYFALYTQDGIKLTTKFVK